MQVPCHKGGHHCSWPACPADCDGRADRYDRILELFELEERAWATVPQEIKESMALVVADGSGVRQFVMFVYGLGIKHGLETAAEAMRTDV